MVAIANIVHVILNAILLLFGTSSSHSHPFVVGIILGVAGVISCLSATIGVMGVASRWNRMHGSAYSLKLYTSVFIGDLSEF